MKEQNINKQLFEKNEGMKRPTAIAIICVLGFVGAAVTIPLIFSDKARQIGSWYPPYLAFSAAIGFVCMLGLWRMKKWAAYSYAGLAGLTQIVLFTMRVWSIMALIIPLTVVGIALAHVKKMT
jgi:hypothetical protein